MNILKAYIKKKKVNNYYKSYYYQNSFYSYDFFERYEVIQAFEKEFTYGSTIQLKGKIDFNASFDEIKQKLGDSRYTTHHEKLKNYQILHYKNKINDLKNRSQLHLFEDSFFYGIQLFIYLSSIQKEELIHLLRLKYSIPANEPLPFKIKDNHNNTLFVSDNIYFSLEYITGNPQVLRSIFSVNSKMLEHQTLRMQKKTQALIDIL